MDAATQTSTLLREYIWLNERPVAVVEGGLVYYVRTDHIGRPVFATDASGTKVWEMTYLPFGGVHTEFGSPINLRFPGQWFQAESGLHQNWMRDYDPTTGRYLQPDPLGLVDGPSIYGYALQSPMVYVDPRGENAIVTKTGEIIFKIPHPAAKVFGACIIGLGILITADQACACNDGCSPSESPIWQTLVNYRGKTKTNGLSGKKRKYFEWDYTHCDIEVYNRWGNHLGSIDAVTGIPTKGPVPGRRIEL